MAKYLFVWYSVNPSDPNLFNFNIDYHDNLNHVRKLVNMGYEILAKKGIQFEWAILKNVNQIDSVFVEGSKTFTRLFRGDYS